jgi:ATP-dependent RNA helicase MSS116
MPPPPPPKRKWNRPRPSGGAPNASAAQQSTIAQQPKRPRVNDAPQQTEGGPVDVKAMYSTAAGNAEAKKFSEMAGKLDKSLLLGLEKMGFEYVHHRRSPPT